MTARVLGGDDWPVWRDLRLRALADSPGAFGSTLAREQAFEEADWRGRLESDGVAVVVERDGDAVGMGAGFRDLPGLLHVVAMWVDPAFRGRGVAREALDAIDAWAGARGLGLHLDVESTNATARRSYASYGFVATGQTRPLRDGSREVAERMLLRDGRPSQPPGHSAEPPPE